MSAQTALMLCAVAVSAALFIDCRATRNVSSAIWVPVVWVAILASRPVVAWFEPSTGLDTNVEDGSAMDRNILSLLMLTAAGILIRRRLNWNAWIRQNGWLVAYLLFCGLSVIWSDYPEVSLKRWIRALGSVLIVLVVVSDKDPVAAIAALVRRCTYVLVPMSVVLIKYYRDFGVGHNYWTGQEILLGVTTDKNALGRLCLVAALFAFWQFLASKHDKHIRMDSFNRLVGAGVFMLTLWLLHASRSATSLASFVIGAFTLLLLGLSGVRRSMKSVGILIVLGGPVIVGVSIALDLPQAVVAALGRDLTLTDRTYIWSDLLKMATNPFIGAGYGSFWVGDRLEYFVKVHQVNEAHNGYLDVYLELGFVGLFLFAGFLFGVFRKSVRTLQTDVTYGRLRMAVLAVFLSYNVTEAGSKPTTFIFLVLLLVAMQVPARFREKRSRETVELTAKPPAPKPEANRTHGVRGRRPAAVRLLPTPKRKPNHL
jgi:O-antigen ligase